jgi:hypothetical protein
MQRQPALPRGVAGREREVRLGSDARQAGADGADGAQVSKKACNHAIMQDSKDVLMHQRSFRMVSQVPVGPGPLV